MNSRAVINPARRTAVIAALIATLAALVGCASQAPRPVDSARTASSRTPSPLPSTSTTIPVPAVTPPARTEDEAIRAANASLLGYYAASFDSGHAGGTRLTHVTPWVTGSTLANERALADYLQRKRYRLEGAPTAWALASSRSSAARTRSPDGAALPYGSVRLVGCITSTNRPVGTGAPSWTTRGRSTSIQWTVLYNRPKQQWLVADSISPSTILRAGSCG